MPKCYWSPFLVWCISGWRSPVLFLVELGAGLSAGRDMPEVMAVAMPAFDAQGTCYGALSLVGPVSRFSAEALRPALAKAADVLSHRRG